jgi:uncharacterized protein YcgI (DUF1989 family)
MTVTDAHTLTVPANGVEAFRVNAGQTFRITDPDGGQVGDLFAYAAQDPSEWLSASHTRAVTNRLFPAVDQHFFTNNRRPILKFSEDHSPGRHDMLIAACDAPRYAALGHPGHPSCAANLIVSLARCGVHRPAVVPQPVNLFMDIQPAPTGVLTWTPASTQPGDYVVLEAVMDCVVILSACPQDIAPVNSGRPTPLVVSLENDAGKPVFDRPC